MSSTDADNTTATTGAASSLRFTVVVARHGERWDYLTRDGGGNWIRDAKSRPDGRPWDPPLTPHGVDQGHLLGQHLARELPRLGLSPVAAVYSSPFLRCRQTAVAARRGLLLNDDDDDKSNDDTTVTPARVRVEYGLAESLNQSWYRSWSLPTSNGTWNMTPPDDLDPATQLHPAARRPVAEILTNWRTYPSPNDNNDVLALPWEHVDVDYASHTQITDAFTYHPHHVESDASQQERMRRVVTERAWAQYCENIKNNQAHQSPTILLVSHGAPVTHLFSSLTGQPVSQHGHSSYCCYSIYQWTVPETVVASLAAQSNSNSTPPPLPPQLTSATWTAVRVNQSDFLGGNTVSEQHL